MPKTETLNIRLEPKLKKEVENTLSDLGLTMAEAITIFFKQVVLTDGIPFEIKRPRYNNTTIGAMAEAKMIMENPERYNSYQNMEELEEDLKD